jgi:hypothetical protein
LVSLWATCFSSSSFFSEAEENDDISCHLGGKLQGRKAMKKKQGRTLDRSVLWGEQTWGIIKKKFPTASMTNEKERAMSGFKDRDS